MTMLNVAIAEDNPKTMEVLNEMLEAFSTMGKKMSPEEKLKEFVGHTPLQVLAGAILGIVIAVVICYL